MRLKRLEILGFKSFADKTKLDFDPGITAVVGPNGCGKSNISDAFRWVLGEQSATSLRGSKMPDVIFAGSTHRKALNFAEVTITLTDINGKLPIEYDEVAVSRRLHRSGESEYFINKHLVRLKDVQALFLDSGMGKDAYSIFEQGKIDEVIKLPPLKRRYIFEEAAGILRFLQRKKEALRKLEQTDLNVSRVKDIHKEVERQIIVLEEQSEKARRYKENKQALDLLEKSLIVSKLKENQVKFQDLKTKITHQDHQIFSTNNQIEILQGELSEAKHSLLLAEKTLKTHAEHVFRVRSNKELQAKEKQTNQERLKDLSSKEKRWEEELKMMEKRRNDREIERKTWQRLQNETVESFKIAEQIVKTHRDKVQLFEDKLMKERELQQAKQKELFKVMQTESQCESEIRQASVRLESAQERQERIYERRERLSEAIAELLKQSEEKKDQLEIAVEAIEKKKEIFGFMEHTLQEIALETNNTQEKLDFTQQDFSDFKARQRALHCLKQDMEGFSQGSKQLLQLALDETSPFFSKIKGLYEYLIPEKGAEVALASAMKPYIQTLVIESESVFEQVIDYVKKHQIKDVSFISLQFIQKAQKKTHSHIHQEALFPLSLSVIECELSQHFLQNVYISKQSQSSLEILKTNPGVEICLSEGAFINHRSVIFYSSQGENNIFLREAELKSLEKKLHEKELEKQQLERVLQAIQEKRNQIQNERIELDKVIRREEMKLVEWNFSIQKAFSDLEKMRAEDKILHVDWQAVKTSIETLTLSLNELNARYKNSKENVAHVQKLAEQMTLQLEKLVTDTKAQVFDLREKEKNLQKILEEQNKHAHALHILEVKDLESLQQEKRLEEEIEIGHELQEQIELKSSEVEKLLIDVEEALVNAVAACTELEEQGIVRKNALEHLEAKIHEKRLVLKKLETERNHSSIQTAQLESARQILESELLERHNLRVDFAETPTPFLDLPLESMEKQMRQLRQLIENAGDINMTSIEECEKYKIRYQFLNQQIDDLDLSKDELIRIIADLDEESRKIFQETFQKVRLNFRKNFEILFNGGEADLQFTESADILEAGIEIIAKPPGKQMCSINLLSGGEKCLTAMALLFAIFEVKPAPFCILDEIDAPLDDSNVERFVNIVKKFVESCQFIIITHNKRTMAIADIICGVSMEEKGVSKIISIDFSPNAKSAMATI